jgi:hypothetical protein
VYDFVWSLLQSSIQNVFFLLQLDLCMSYASFVFSGLWYLWCHLLFCPFNWWHCLAVAASTYKHTCHHERVPQGAVVGIDLIWSACWWCRPWMSTVSPSCSESVCFSTHLVFYCLFIAVNFSVNEYCKSILLWKRLFSQPRFYRAKWWSVILFMGMSMVSEVVMVK